MISEKILVFDQKNEIIVRQNQNSHLKSSPLMILTGICFKVSKNYHLLSLNLCLTVSKSIFDCLWSKLKSQDLFSNLLEYLSRDHCFQKFSSNKF